MEGIGTAGFLRSAGIPRALRAIIRSLVGRRCPRHDNLWFTLIHVRRQKYIVDPFCSNAFPGRVRTPWFWPARGLQSSLRTSQHKLCSLPKVGHFGSSLRCPCSLTIRAGEKNQPTWTVESCVSQGGWFLHLSLELWDRPSTYLPRPERLAM